MIDPDAALLAMENSEELLFPASLYEKFYQDLSIIRAAYPTMASIHHQALWIPGELIGQLTDKAMAQFEAGEYHGLDALSAQYGPIEIIPTDNGFVTFKFSQLYTPEYLTRPVSAADGVYYAHAKWITDDGNRIEVSGTQYTFKLGWGDCKSICPYYHCWTFSVIDGVANRVDEYGDPLISGLSVTNDGPTTPGSATQLIVEVDARSHPDITYTWDFGDGTPVRNGETEITHVYSAMGQYRALVTASSFGQSVTAATTVTAIS